MLDRTKVSAKSSEAKNKNSVSQMKKTDFTRSMNSPVDDILFLQRTIGNQAVQKLIKSGFIQEKLRISESGDIYGREADRVAEQVMRIPEPHVQRQDKEEELTQLKPLAEQVTPKVQRQVKEEAAGTPKTGKAEYCLDKPWARTKRIINSNFHILVSNDKNLLKWHKELESRVSDLEK